MKNNYSLPGLRAFEAVLRHESFKKAAADLQITDGALSQHIKKLEDDLGYIIFATKRPRVVLTPEGEKLKHGVVEAFDILRSTVVPQNVSYTKTRLRIAIDAFSSSSWLTNGILNFSKQLNNIEIFLETYEKGVDLLTQKFDVAICLNGNEPTGWKSYHIGKEFFVIVSSPEIIEHYYLDDAKQLRNVPILTEHSLHPLSGSTPWNKWLHSTGTRIIDNDSVIHFGANSGQAIHAAVSGAGVLFTRLSLAHSALSRNKLYPLFKTCIDSELSFQLIHSGNSTKISVILDLLKSIKNAFLEIDEQRTKIKSMFSKNIIDEP